MPLSRKWNYLLVLFTIIGVVMFAACAFNQPAHQIYIYHGPEGFDDAIGSMKQIPIQWKASPGPTTNNSTPDTVMLNVELVGPFTSIDDFLRGVRQSKASNGAFVGKFVVASSKPITTDSWTNKTYTSFVDVPPNLKPGYYDLYYTVLVKSPDGHTTMTRADAPVKINLPKDFPNS